MSMRYGAAAMVGLLAVWPVEPSSGCERAGSSASFRRPPAVGYARPMVPRVPYYPPPPVNANYGNLPMFQYGNLPVGAYGGNLAYANVGNQNFNQNLINYSTFPGAASQQLSPAASTSSFPRPAPVAMARPTPAPAPPPEPTVRMRWIQFVVQCVRNASDGDALERQLVKVAGVKLVTVKRSQTGGTTVKVWFSEKDPVGPEAIITASSQLGFAMEVMDAVATGATGGS